jgi:hypothetical protein
MSKCVLTAEAEEHLSVNTFVNKPVQFQADLDTIEFIPSNPFNSKSNKSESKLPAGKISIKNIKFCKVAKCFNPNEINSNKDLDDTFAGPSHVSNSDDFSSDLANMSLELESFDNNLNRFELDRTPQNSNDLSTLQNYQEFSNEHLNNPAYTDNFQSSFSDEEIDQKHDEFPNEAYADLMILVTKYKLSNAAGNAIITFFNKHSNHSKSPLPKNIKQGKEFMNNINSNLSYKKTKILELDNTEYFLYHLPLISCIENILEIPDIAQNLEFEYKELYKTTKVYITFNILILFEIQYLFVLY